MRGVTFIVSCKMRPLMLRCCLASIANQRGVDREVFVTDNSPDEELRLRHGEVLGAWQLCTRPLWLTITHIQSWRHEDLRADCYWPADYVVLRRDYPQFDWLCFPSDDNFYLSNFAERLLHEAESRSLDLVYCDTLTRVNERHACIRTAAAVERIDKGGFLVRKSVFIEAGGFKDKPPWQKPVPCAADGMFVERVAKDGRWKVGKVNDVLVVHQ